MHTRRPHLTQDELQGQVDSGTVDEAASSGTLFPVVSESLPAWQAAGIFASSVGMTMQPEEDINFGVAMNVDAASHPMFNSSATMAEVVAMQSTIAPTPVSDADVWKVLQERCPQMCRTLTGRAGYGNKLQCLCKCILTGYWATALWVAAHCK